MFISLYGLSAKSTDGRRPLEDFTTEALAGVLRMDSSFLEQFCQLIAIPPLRYQVKTQVAYSSENRDRYYVDLVLSSGDHICFIENKVNSKEGENQLSRYREAIDKSHPDKARFLRYCTKYREDKNVDDINFKQYTWHDIANLAQRSENKLTVNFYDFLKEHNMANNHNLTAEKLTTISHMQDTLITLNHYLDSAKTSFVAAFCSDKASRVSKGSLTDSGNNRMGYRITPIIESDSKYNEVMYSIDLDDPRLNVHVYLDKRCDSIELFKKHALLSSDFSFHESEGGVAIHINKTLSDFNFPEDPTNEIKNWYDDSFKKVQKFMLESAEIKWNTEIKS